MPTDAEQLATIRSGILATLVEIYADPERPKVTYDIDGQKISWTEYKRSLLKELAEVNKLLQQDGPFEIHSQGYT